MATTCRETAIEQMLQTVEEAMSRAQLGTAIDSVERARSSLSVPLHHRENLKLDEPAFRVRMSPAGSTRMARPASAC
jgi:hypothetical protein